VFRFHIDLNADPDPAIYLNADPDTDLAPDLGFANTLEVIFYISYFPFYQNSTKSVNFFQFYGAQIRIRNSIANLDPDL
jgi:hypothetical protein